METKEKREGIFFETGVFVSLCIFVFFFFSISFKFFNFQFSAFISRLTELFFTVLLLLKRRKEGWRKGKL